jgi:hypothetical protein
VMLADENPERGRIEPRDDQRPAGQYSSLR